MPSLPPLTHARLLRSAAVALLAIPSALHAQHTTPAPTSRAALGQAPRDWRHGATCYEIFVRSFADGDGDGVGDLKGLTARLDYINDGNPRSTKSLGAPCVWLMPVMASPSYHGYDATDYYRVEPGYGTAVDFRRFVAAAHRRGIAVLIDMVLNHTSNQHPHFQAALHDTASPYRAWYRFSPTKPAVKGPWGQEVWHKSPVRDEWYYGVFYDGMPDLDYETPAVRAEANKIARYWLTEMGVDGFRLDAVPYLVERGDTLAGSAATHRVLHDYAASVRRVRPNAYTVGEVWDSVGAQRPYYPDQLEAYFTFELADAIVDGARTGNGAKILPVALRVQRELPRGRYAPFLRNHDQTRTMTALGGDPARARLAATLLLTLPGLPFVYYGEELGMTGDKPDERLRTPMAWDASPHAGFTRGTPWEAMQGDSATANVAAQDGDAESLLNLYRRLIHLRASNPALATGTLLPLTASSDSAVAYVRRDGGRAVLVVANLGASPLAGLTLAAPARTLPVGRWTPTPIVGGGRVAPLVVGADGGVAGYAPLPTLAAKTAYVFGLGPTR